MLGKAWALLKDTIEGYIADECLSRGAAIAYYTIFSVAPLLIIATAIAGFFFGDEAVHGALDDQLRGMLGQEAAEGIQSMVKGASNQTSGTIATIVGVVTLLLTASGVFGELQASLNAVWKADPDAAKPADADTVTTTVSRLVKARAASMGLVAATGFLLLTSLLASAALSAVSDWIGGLMPGWEFLLALLNFAVSFGIITALFAMMYKVLPDRRMEWRDVLIGAVATAFLFVVGKSLIGWYLGSSNVATSYGAASAVLIVLLWVYYSSQIFLLGAEFTRAYAGQEGSHKHAPVPGDAQAAPGTRKAKASLVPPPVVEPEPLLSGNTLWKVLGAATVAVAAVKQARRGRPALPALLKRGTPPV
ncbi:YihY/virulence factor BrkB family protein [Roseomonas sp. BN140053]|uniref:YihY/virulence factor BrkB family protein n=1 Tax=Roseomonas sp. BN140053 TaxID=3391898 RepID=UPI0039E90E01